MPFQSIQVGVFTSIPTEKLDSNTLDSPMYDEEVLNGWVV